MTELELHIMPEGDRWHVRRDGTSVAVYDTRDDALRQACDRAELICGRQDWDYWTMVLHDDQGQVQRRMTVPY